MARYSSHTKLGHFGSVERRANSRIKVISTVNIELDVVFGTLGRFSQIFVHLMPPMPYAYFMSRVMEDNQSDLTRDQFRISKSLLANKSIFPVQSSVISGMTEKISNCNSAKLAANVNNSSKNVLIFINVIQKEIKISLTQIAS